MRRPACIHIMEMLYQLKTVAIILKCFVARVSFQFLQAEKWNNALCTRVPSIFVHGRERGRKIEGEREIVSEGVRERDSE